MTKRMVQYWVIPPEQNAEFVAGMEEVLETYAMPYDPEQPVVCMDEQPIQLTLETKEPVAATAGHPQRVDYEYEVFAIDPLTARLSDGFSGDSEG